MFGRRALREDVERNRSSGAAAHLTYPAHLPALAAIIRDVITMGRGTFQRYATEGLRVG